MLHGRLPLATLLDFAEALQNICQSPSALGRVSTSTSGTPQKLGMIKEKTVEYGQEENGGGSEGEKEEKEPRLRKKQCRQQINDTPPKVEYHYFETSIMSPSLACLQKIVES